MDGWMDRLEKRTLDPKKEKCKTCPVYCTWGGGGGRNGQGKNVCFMFVYPFGFLVHVRDYGHYPEKKPFFARVEDLPFFVFVCCPWCCVWMLNLI